MTKNQFVYNNVPIKKISYGRQKGMIEIKLSDSHFNILYHGKAKINDKIEVEKMLKELKDKGFDLFREASWI